MNLHTCFNFSETDEQYVLCAVLNIKGYRVYTFLVAFVLFHVFIIMQSQSKFVILQTLQLLRTKLKLIFFQF